MAATRRLHLGSPLPHGQVPAFDWHRFGPPLLAALVIVIGVLFAASMPRPLEAARDAAATALRTAAERADRADTRGDRLFPRPTVSYEHMYARDVRAPSAESMYAHPRPLYFD